MEPMRITAMTLALAAMSGCTEGADRQLAPPAPSPPSAAFIHAPGELSRMALQAEKFCSMYGGIPLLERDVPLGDGDLLAEFTCVDIAD